MHNFHVKSPAKWVLAGEHAVLHGETAVALVHPALTLELDFKEGGHALEVFPRELGPEILELIEAVSDRWSDDDRSFPKLRGRLSISSTIPIGAGLGSSAALSVAFTKWLAGSLGFGESEYFEFAKQLEHRFHGRSSGMDVAAILAKEPIAFSVEKGVQTLGVKKLPKFTLHDTGIRARTSECIVRVEKFREDFPTLAMQTDALMGQASRQAIEGLIRFDATGSRESVDLIAQAMKSAQECFAVWQLIPGAALRLAQDLEKQGARAVKITGAGGGGFLVALWDA